LAPSLNAAVPDDESVRLNPLVVIATPAEHALTVALDPRAPAQPVPAQDGADALRAIPGIQVIRKGGIDGDPLLRGMAGSRLGVVLDDQLLLGGCGHRMDPPTAYVFPALYDRVTLLKGPQSVRHGPGHSAGVVRFERDPRRFDTTAASLHSGLTFGSFGRNDQAVDVTAGSRLGYAQLSANRAEAGNFRDGDGREVHSAYRRWSAQAALGWTPDRATRIELSTAFSDGEAAYADRTMDGARFARNTVGLRFERDLTGGAVTRIEANVYRNVIDHVMDNYSLRTFTPSMAMPAPSASNPDRETFGGRAQLTLAPGTTWSLDAGIDGQANLHTNRSTMNEIARPYGTLPRLEDARFGQIGVFGEWTRHFDDRTRLLAGARLDAWQVRDRRATVSTGMMGSAPNPTAGARRDATLPSGFIRYEAERGPVTAFAGVGHSARFPDYWELFSKESTTTVSAFDTAPEKTTQFDAGLLFRRGRLQASAALFASRVDDFILIESGVRKGMRTATIARSIEATTFGGEATVAIDLSEAWRLDTSVAAVRGENRTDDLPLAQQPPLETRVHLAYTSGAWNAGLLLRAVAAQNRHALNQGNIVGQDLGPSDAFAVTSLHASRAFGPRARISAGVDNLFDTTYAEHLSRGGATIAGFPPPSVRIAEPGRTLWLKLDLSL
jgi:iron complex outermembrane receptor protein